MQTYTIPDLISKFIIQHNISDVFSISGGYNILLLDSFKKHNINMFFFQHQQAITMAAQGYYKLTGKIPMCVVTAGPGAINTLTGVYGA